MGSSKNPLIIFGALLVLAGIVALAIPVFTTHQTEEVARIGDLKVQTQENTTHTIPPLVAGAAVALGIVLIGAGLFRKP